MEKRSFFNNLIAALFTGQYEYPQNVPYHPPEKYPEYQLKETDESNHVYRAVRSLLFELGLDKKHFNNPAWNPFGEFIEPGMTVFIKPNTVVHKHQRGKDINSIIVHASMIRPILDYVCKALDDKGVIYIGDSQLYMSNFDTAMDASGISALLKWYREQTPVRLECFDLRLNKGKRTWLYGRWAREKIEKDSRGYTWVNLAEKSCFRDIDPKRLRIAIASHKDMYRHHSAGKHEYGFPNSLLQSDVVISIPKLKTHRRTAVTLAVKNFMGIPAAKDCLPHFITGSVQEGGDQYIHPSRRKNIVTFLHDQIQSSPYMPVKFVCAIAKKLLWNTHFIVPFKDDVYEAMWPGNDTIWRTLADLNRIILYANKHGIIQKTPQRKLLYLMDGLIGGEGDGPLACDPKPAGVLMAGFNPIALDAVAAAIMGFDIEKIPTITRIPIEPPHDLPLFRGTVADVMISDSAKRVSFREYVKDRNLQFKAHPNWQGHVER